MADLQTLPGVEVAFTSYNPKRPDKNGILAQFEDGTILRSFMGYGDSMLQEKGTHFGYVYEGMLSFCYEDTLFQLNHGFYFAIPGFASIQPRYGGIIIGITAPAHKGFFHIGKIEEQGRLRYIDGCTDSLLISPVKFGDPCLNLLYFPPNTDQTMHTHPSNRIGMILSGRGICITEDSRGPMQHDLLPGMFFCIHANGKHKFRTKDREMRVLAWHTDSDFVPNDEDHPMINRTMVNGVSAREIGVIHTK